MNIILTSFVSPDWTHVTLALWVITSCQGINVTVMKGTFGLFGSPLVKSLIRILVEAKSNCACKNVCVIVLAWLSTCIICWSHAPVSWPDELLWSRSQFFANRFYAFPVADQTEKQCIATSAALLYDPLVGTVGDGFNFGKLTSHVGASCKIIKIKWLKTVKTL